MNDLNKPSKRIPLRRKLVYVIIFFALIFCAFVGTGYEASKLGPYTRWHNENLESKATQANLIGSSVVRISSVLGTPNNIREFWTVLGPDMKPVPDAEYVTTYEYYPYPWLPFSKFQVHTTNGIVGNFEKFDD